MKIGVISDTHGERAAMERAVAAVGIVDEWLHAGDHMQDAAYIRSITGLRVTAVLGNCDGRSGAKLDEFIELAGRKIWLTHGHRYHVKESLQDLAWWARQYAVDGVVFGHSHQAVRVWTDNILFFNPGSAAHPRYGAPTCGLLEITQEGQLLATVIELD